MRSSSGRKGAVPLKNQDDNDGDDGEGFIDSVATPAVENSQLGYGFLMNSLPLIDGWYATIYRWVLLGLNLGANNSNEDKPIQIINPNSWQRLPRSF